MRLASVVRATLITQAAFAAPALADVCPTSDMAFSGNAPFVSTAAAFDSTDFLVDFYGHRVGFDHPMGSVEVHHCCNLGRTYTKARDRYDVVGVPAGTHVGVVAELSVEGAILGAGCGGSGCWGTLGYSLTAGANTIADYRTTNIYSPGSVPVQGGLALPLTIVAGQPVTIERQLWAQRAAGGNNGATGIGRLRFTGLPEGVRVVSCQGFEQDPVPALRASWGRVKAAYR